jgi:hypothetical protein
LRFGFGFERREILSGEIALRPLFGAGELCGGRVWLVVVRAAEYAAEMAHFVIGFRPVVRNPHMRVFSGFVGHGGGNLISAKTARHWLTVGVGRRFMENSVAALLFNQSCCRSTSLCLTASLSNSRPNASRMLMIFCNSFWITVTE